VSRCAILGACLRARGVVTTVGAWAACESASRPLSCPARGRVPLALWKGPERLCTVAVAAPSRRRGADLISGAGPGPVIGVK
jgi:hypothetical protein